MASTKSVLERMIAAMNRGVRRRCKKSCPESEGHRRVCEAKTEEEKACSKEEPSSLTKNSQL
jgi:hypothetical protein